MSPVPFVVVTGFLGSGKTTLLKRMILEQADARRLAVVQNEFAPAGVDGEELRMTGKRFEILEINRGSVFCVCLLSDFVKSLSRLVDDVRPEAVVLEATGLADPIALAQLLHAPELRERVYLAHAYCVVDAAGFLAMEKAIGRVSHQVRVADTVIVNKTDLSSQVALSAVEARVRELNPFAAIVHATHCAVPTVAMFDAPPQAPVALRREFEHASLESCGRPAVASVAVRSTRRYTRASLEAFLGRHAPGTYRLKGYVHTTDCGVLAVQSCYGSLQISPVTGYNGATELVAMGPGLDPDSFRAAFESA